MNLYPAILFMKNYEIALVVYPHHNYSIHIDVTRLIFNEPDVCDETYLTINQFILKIHNFRDHYCSIYLLISTPILDVSMTFVF